jgi:hypothetical protein
MSAQAETSRKLKCPSVFKYAALIFPQPIMPSLIFFPMAGTPYKLKFLNWGRCFEFFPNISFTISFISARERTLAVRGS